MNKRMRNLAVVVVLSAVGLPTLQAQDGIKSGQAVLPDSGRFVQENATALEVPAVVGSGAAGSGLAVVPAQFTSKIPPQQAPAATPPAFTPRQGAPVTSQSPAPWQAQQAPASPASGRGPRRYARVVSTGEAAPSQGQEWRSYDLRPYLEAVRGLQNPQQPLVDWVLRETGTERWFGDVPGMISVEGDQLRVYHLPEIHEVVADIVDRFVDPALSATGVSVRLITVESIDWRSVAMPLMQPIPVQTPGVEAWLLKRENAALLVSHLRQRADVREHNSSRLQIPHGQSQTIERWQPRTYPKTVQATPNRYPGYELKMGQIREGFSLRISPLAERQPGWMQAVIQCQIAQIEKMSSLPLSMPSIPGQPMNRMEVQVPQLASWRIQERFRWPVDHVLVISRGVVGVPGGGQSSLGIPILAGGPPRADAILFIACHSSRGSGAGQVQGGTSQARRMSYHNRY